MKKKIWIVIGKVLFIVLWLPLNVILRFTKRTRILVVSDNKVLLLKCWMGPRKWMLPGGGIKRGETPLQGALRELKEETGIVVNAKQLTYLGITRVPGPFRFRYKQYLTHLPKQATPILQKHEIIDAVWLDISSVHMYGVSKEVTAALGLLDSSKPT